MKKILLPIMILCTAVSANADVRLFTGGELGADSPSNNISDIANYRYFSGSDNISWGDPISQLSVSGDVSEVTAFDKNFNWFGYGDFKYTQTDGTVAEYSIPTTLRVATSIDTRNQSVFCYSKEDVVINILLGSADAEEETLKFITATQRFKSKATSVTNIIRDSDAVQTRFEIHTSDNPINVCRGTVNYGTLETGAINYIETQRIRVDGGSLSIYADKIVAKSATTDSKIASGAAFTLVVSNPSDGGGLSDVDPILTENGKFIVEEGAALNFDFSALEGDYEDTFVLIQAAAFEGLTSENVDNIVDVIGLEGKSWDFDIIDVENAQQLTITISPAVPEPATVASILGILALGFVAYRRRK